MRVCVFECALRAKLIFLFIQKNQNISVFSFVARRPLLTAPRATNIIFDTAAKNIIYVLFMIFRFPLALYFFIICLFRRFSCARFYRNLFDLYAAPLGHTLRDSNTDADSAADADAQNDARTRHTRPRPALLYVCTITFHNLISIPFRIQIQIQRVIIIICAVRHNWRAAFTAYFLVIYFIYTCFSIILKELLRISFQFRYLHTLLSFL